MKRNYNGEDVFEPSDMPLCVFRKRVIHYSARDKYHFGPEHPVDDEEWSECLGYPCPYFDSETYWCKKLGFDRPEGYSNLSEEEYRLMIEMEEENGYK